MGVSPLQSWETSTSKLTPSDPLQDPDCTHDSTLLSCLADPPRGEGEGLKRGLGRTRGDDLGAPSGLKRRDRRVPGRTTLRDVGRKVSVITPTP